MKESEQHVKSAGQTAESLQPRFRVITPGINDVDYAEQISGWTKQGRMLPKEPQDVLTLFESGHSVILVNAGGELVSHAAVTFIYPDGSLEIGAVVTSPDHQRQGAASQAVVSLIKELKPKYPDQTFFALANDSSEPMFQKLGAPQMTTTDLAPEVFEECQDCPVSKLKPQEDIFVCCDTPFNLTNIDN